MILSTLTQQSQLRDKLFASLQKLQLVQHGTPLDCIVTHCEINDRQGVGILLRQIWGHGQQFITVRSQNLYDGVQDFGKVNFLVKHVSANRITHVRDVTRTIRGYQPKRILSVPYFLDDVFSTIALKHKFNVPLCTYLMDDQNIYTNKIPDLIMQELLKKSDICFGISKELCKAYETKYGVKFWWIPPVIPQRLIQTTPEVPQLNPDQPARGIIIGNIWSPAWLERLQNITRETGIQLDWYAKPNRDWLPFEENDLAANGIQFQGFLPESELINVLRKAAFAVVPTGMTDDERERPEITKLSLPSRISFLMAAGNIPILVVGRQDSAAAKFVTTFKLGAVCDYELQSFKEAVERIITPDAQTKIRDRAAEISSRFASDEVGSWILESLDRQEPMDMRFEYLYPQRAVIASMVKSGVSAAPSLKNASVLITQNEVSPRHGTGALVNRIFAETPSVFSIRSYDHYEGQQTFGDVQLLLSQNGASRPQVFQNILANLQNSTVKQAFCIPYSTEELLSSIAVKEIFNVPLGTYIMDDQNVVINNIPDMVMREFLTKCSIRFATHPELRAAYEAKYGLQFWLLPAIVPHKFINPEPALIPPTSANGILIGSIWSKHWFESLQAAVQGAGAQLDWYGHNQYCWLTESLESIKQKGITSHGILAEDQLVTRLRQALYVIVPAGMLDNEDDRQELSRLSLPGRIIFVMAASGTPVIIMGSEKTGAARFVRRFKIGAVCDYDAEQLKAAIAELSQPGVQQEIRQRAAAIAFNFSDKGIRHWVWRSLALGEPADNRFESVFPVLPDEKPSDV